MSTSLKLFLVLLVIGLVIDYLWIGFIAKNFYLQQLSEIARIRDGKIQPRMVSAFMVYVLLVAGIILFALPLIPPMSALWMSFLWGAIFGGIVYGVYDFTNYATLEKWTLPMTMVDIAWGAFICGLLTMLGHYLRDSVFA